MMKHLMKSICTLLAALGTFSAPAQTPQLRPDNIDEIVKAMTLEEKLLFVKGTNEMENNGPVVGQTERIVPGAAGTTYPIPRLGIPAIVMADGPAGLRIAPTREFDSHSYFCTHFPIGTALASTWNTELVELVGRAIGEEARDYGVDVLLAPAMNIHRNPLTGRNFEYYSEDPLVSARIAAAYIKGVQHNEVGTSLKHFAVNNQESNRSMVDVHVSRRALREIYIRGFEWTLKDADPWTLMSSYNKVNGVYTSEDKALLTTILRGDWGYKGMVVTDWFGGKDAAAQMRAGNNMLQPGYPQEVEQIKAALKAGSLTVADIDKNVKKILELIVKTRRYHHYQYNNAPNLKAHAQTTRSTAAEAMVLLENKGGLPLRGVKQVAVYGCTGYGIIPGGTGSGNVNRAYTVSLVEGLRNNGYAVSEDVLEAYRKYLKSVAVEDAPKDVLSKQTLPAEYLPPVADVEREAATSDAAIVVIGRSSGEGYDLHIDDFDLTTQERQLIAGITEAFHKQGKKVVVVLNIGAPIEVASWRHLPDAILCAWQVGQEGGNSMADMLSGRTTPSGKLTMTWPVKVMDHPSSKNMPLDSPMFDFDTGRKVQTSFDRKNIDYVNYDEDIYVGYRYFDTFNREVTYPFGYGLSYTTFDYANAKAAFDGKTVVLTVDVRNAGSAPGKEVVEVYVKAPEGALEKPVHELKAFAKTRELQPGETETLTMTVNLRDLASFDTQGSRWIADKGTYECRFSANSRDVRAKASFTLGTAYREKVSDVMRPRVKLQLLRQQK